MEEVVATTDQTLLQEFPEDNSEEDKMAAKSWWRGGLHATQERKAPPDPVA